MSPSSAVCLLVIGAAAGCGPSRRAPSPAAAVTTDGSATPQTVLQLLESRPSIYVPRETSKGWFCDAWTYAPQQGDNLARLVSPKVAFPGQCNDKGSPLAQVEWEFEVDGTVLGATPLYDFADGQVLATSHSQFIAVLRVINDVLDVANFQSPDHAAARSGPYTVGHWYLSAAACKRATRLDDPAVLAVSAETLAPPPYSCAAH